MTWVEIGALVALGLMLVVVVGVAFQIRAINREIRSEGRETRLLVQGTSLAKPPHRCQWKLATEERTNKVHRLIYLCGVLGCTEVKIDEEPEGDG